MVRESAPVPELNRDLDADETTAAKVRTACAGLPRWTVAPLLNASCIYLRRNVLDAVGVLSPILITLCGHQQLGLPVPVAGVRGEASQSCLRPSRQRPGAGYRHNRVARSRIDSNWVRPKPTSSVRSGRSANLSMAVYRPMRSGFDSVESSGLASTSGTYRGNKWAHGLTPSVSRTRWPSSPRLT